MVKLEHDAISWAVSNIHDQQYFEQIQYLLNSHRLMHSPTRSQCHEQAERDGAALAADSVGFIAGLSEREAQYLQKELVIRDDSAFLTLKDISTALEELTDEVSRHGFKIRAVYDHYQTSKDAFTPDQALAIKRAVGLRCLAGKTAFKQIRSMLREKHKLSESQVQNEFADALGTLEWLKPRDLDFTEAVYDGRITIARLAALRPLASILEKLIDAPARPLTAKHLCHHPSLILTLAQTCSGELATRAALYVSQALMNPKLHGNTALRPLIERLEGYRSHPEVHFNLCMLKRANGLMTTEDLRGRLKPYKDAALVTGLNKVFKHPADLTMALNELAIAIPPALLRRNGKSFTQDLGV
ncbi:hypothetical protein [Pseudomonas sp. PLMAX]|uniref:hypothetical protein n=1 Tax=Pseudomonas sp. PLMAX TaxID=2201998 RepID=UPI0038BB8A95